MPYYRYVVRGKQGAVDAYRNVFYLQTDSTITNHTTVGSELLNQIYANLTTWMPVTVEYGDVDVAEWSGSAWGVNVLYSTTAQQGTDEGDALPHQIAAVVTAYTNKLRCRGRKFFGPLSEAANEDGKLVPLALTSLIAIANIWTAGIQPAGQPAVHFVIQSKDNSFQSIRSTAARELLATMRLRKPGKGMG